MYLTFRFLFICMLFVSHTTFGIITIETIFGTETIYEPVIEELIASDAFQRLQHINQYGCNRYTFSPYDYTRYSHSLGVFILLRKYNAPLKEQIAGLLHDISHTVFSHVGDHLYRNSNYQDNIHVWYLRQSGIAHILEKHGYQVEDMNIKRGDYPLLEQSLPNLCADRIEYTIHGGYLEGKLDKEMIPQLMVHLHVKNNIWYFDDPSWARTFADVSLYLTQEVFACPKSIVSYDWCAQALHRALALGKLTSDDIHFSIDDVVWQKLLESDDVTIKKYMNYLTNCQAHFKVCSEQQADTYFSPKFRGQNPLVETKEGMFHLTELDADYKKNYEELQKYLNNGYYVQYVQE